MTNRISRREALQKTGLAVAGGVPVLSSKNVHTETRNRGAAFIYSLNTSTIRGQKLSLVEEIEIASKAGYHAIEPWISEIDHHVQSGGTLVDLKNRLHDHGLSVESAIGFFDWIVDDPNRRKTALEEARRNMEMLAKIGGKRLAAPPTGATGSSDIPLPRIAERYRALLEVGDQFGVVPQAEIWGFSKTLSTLGEAAQIAIESGHPSACILPDVYHLYKGGSHITGLRLLSAAAFHNFHINDYPANPPREQIDDSYRVYPGDGAAPLKTILRILHEIGYHGALSIELFNQDYYNQDALLVARRALEKLKAVVKNSV